MTQWLHSWVYVRKMKTLIQKDTCTPIFIVIVVTVTKIWKQAKCPSVDEWIQNTWHTHAQWTTAAAAAKSLQSSPTLCDPIDNSPPGSAVPGILQVKTLEWVAISFSNTWKWKVKVKLLSCVRLLATLRTAAYQAPPSMGFSRQEYWSGVPLPSPPTPYRGFKRSWI